LLAQATTSLFAQATTLLTGQQSPQPVDKLVDNVILAIGSRFDGPKTVKKPKQADYWSDQIFLLRIELAQPM